MPRDNRCVYMAHVCFMSVVATVRGSKVRPRNFGCVAMGSAVLFILRSRLLLYSARSGVNRVQVVLFCPGKNLM